MNLSTEDNLPLFKYTPEITSQLLIQTNEAQEYVQIPNICDDLLLTGLEDGTYTWTLNSLPISLNNQNDCQSFLINPTDQEELQPHKEILSDLLNEDNVENQFEGIENGTEIVLPLELSEKNFLTENGLYISTNHEDISTNCGLISRNVTFDSEINSEITRSEEVLKNNIKNEIQSSDVSSQEAFIDISGLLISQQSVLNLNTLSDFPFNIPEIKSNGLDISVSNNKLKNKNRKTYSSKRSIKIDLNHLQNTNYPDDVENLHDTTEPANNDALFNIDDLRTINLEGASTFLNVDGSPVPISSNFHSNKKFDELEEIGLQIDNEPDSTTILNDLDETLNINELATIVQTYQCKKCDFACNDREEFLTHFKEVHPIFNKKKPQLEVNAKLNRTIKKLLKVKKVPFIKDRQIKKSEDTPLFQLILNEKGDLVNNTSLSISEESSIQILNDIENTNNVQVLKEEPSEEPIDLMYEREINELENYSAVNTSESETNVTKVSNIKLETNLNSEIAVNSFETTGNSYEPLKIIYNDKEYTGFAVLIQHEEVEKKIMRVKRKRKPAKKKIICNNYSQNYAIKAKALKNSSGVTYSLTDIKKLQIDSVASNTALPVVTVATNISNIEQLLQDQQHSQEPVVESNLQQIFLCANDISATEVSTNDSTVQEDLQQQQAVENEVTDDLSPIYLCATCSEQFSSVDECKVHYKDVHKYEDEIIELQNNDDNTTEQNLSRITDAELPNQKQILEKFFNQDLKKRKHKCPVKGCPYRFPKIDLLKRHETCHMNGTRTPFCCPECKEQFNSWRMCSVHLWKCHKVDIDFYTCPLCDYKGSTCDKLKHHIKIHSEDREYVCPDCGRDFKQPSQLRNHRVIHLDKKNVLNIPRWYVQKYCEICGKLFADSKCLKKHVQAVHSKLKPFICNVCGHSCARKAMLQLHLRQHTGDKPYSCTMCRFKTGDHNSLRRHNMRHTGDRQYKCPYCDYAAIQSNSYKNHLSTKHPGKLGFFECNECSFKTVNVDIFYSHRNDHNLGFINSDKNKSSDKSLIINMRNNNNSSSEFSSNDISTQNGRRICLEDSNKNNYDMEDDETQNCLFSFSSLTDLTDEITVDTGGITIPADPHESNPLV